MLTYEEVEEFVNAMVEESMHGIHPGDDAVQSLHELLVTIKASSYQLELLAIFFVTAWMRCTAHYETKLKESVERESDAWGRLNEVNAEHVGLLEKYNALLEKYNALLGEHSEKLKELTELNKEMSVLYEHYNRSLMEQVAVHHELVRLQGELGIQLDQYTALAIDHERITKELDAIKDKRH